MSLFLEATSSLPRSLWAEGAGDRMSRGVFGTPCRAQTPAAENAALVPPLSNVGSPARAEPWRCAASWDHKTKTKQETNAPGRSPVAVRCGQRAAHGAPLDLFRAMVPGARFWMYPCRGERGQNARSQKAPADVLHRLLGTGVRRHRRDFVTIGSGFGRSWAEYPAGVGRTRPNLGPMLAPTLARCRPKAGSESISGAANLDRACATFLPVRPDVGPRPTSTKVGPHSGPEFGARLARSRPSLRRDVSGQRWLDFDTCSSGMTPRGTH